MTAEVTDRNCACDLDTLTRRAVSGAGVVLVFVKRLAALARTAVVLFRALARGLGRDYCGVA